MRQDQGSEAERETRKRRNRMRSEKGTKKTKKGVVENPQLVEIRKGDKSQKSEQVFKDEMATSQNIASVRFPLPLYLR